MEDHSSFEKEASVDVEIVDVTDTMYSDNNQMEQSGTTYENSEEEEDNDTFFDQDLARRQSLMMHDNNATAIAKYININSLTGRVKWGVAEEKIVNSYIRKALAYKVLYNRAYFRYRKYDKYLKWPLAILSCISLAVEAIYATLVTSESLPYVAGTIIAITIACLTAVVTSLTYWRSKESYDGLADGCRKAAIAFSEFADQLRTILDIDKSHRTNPLEVINNMQFEYKKIRKLFSEFVIPSDIYKKFMKENSDETFIMDVATSNTENFNIFDDTYDKKSIVNEFLGKLISFRDEASRKVDITEPDPSPLEAYDMEV